MIHVVIMMQHLFMKVANHSSILDCSIQDFSLACDSLLRVLSYHVDRSTVLLEI